MSRAAVEAFLYLMDEAFEGLGIEETGESQALVPNLATVTETRWHALPAGGSRTIEAIVRHVASCKVMYDHYAFGPGRLDWDDHDVDPWPNALAPMKDVLRWLREAHAALRGHVSALEDQDLDVDRATNWGEHRPTRWIVSTMIQHDLYHAGEINHLRGLLDGDDRWMFERENG